MIKRRTRIPFQSKQLWLAFIIFAGVGYFLWRLVAAAPLSLNSLPSFNTPVRGTEKRSSNEFGGQNDYLYSHDGKPFAIKQTDSQGRTIQTTFFRADGGRTIILADYAASSESQLTAKDNRTVNCSTQNDAEAYYGFHWAKPVKWDYNPTNQPASLNQSAVIGSLVAAHKEWQNNDNRCGITDNSKAQMIYDGINRSAKFGDKDGVNTIVWGDISPYFYFCGLSAIACVSLWEDAGGNLTDADIIFSTKWPNWTTKGEANKEDIWSVGAHEVGHTLGFGHVSNYYNIMYPSIPYGTYTQKLGLGDAKENNLVY